MTKVTLFSQITGKLNKEIFKKFVKAKATEKRVLSFCQASLLCAKKLRLSTTIPYDDTEKITDLRHIAFDFVVATVQRLDLSIVNKHCRGIYQCHRSTLLRHNRQSKPA